MKYLKEKGFTLVELMIVIVIVGILAAVAIPKFSIAADKARASEFPTVLTGIYTNQEAYKAESGTYAPAAGWNSISMTDPSKTAGQSKWFNYTWTTPTSSTYTAKATVAGKFGDLAGTETATINQSGAKGCNATLQKYAPQWK
jgi:type IV pilus assembly protein PilE